MYVLRALGLLAMRSTVALLGIYKAPKLDPDQYYVSADNESLAADNESLADALKTRIRPRRVGSVPVCYAATELGQATNRWSPYLKKGKGG